MIQVKQANNPKYNTDSSSLEMKQYLNQIASTENLRDQLVKQIYIITDIQKSINNDSIKQNLDGLLSKYNESITNINGSIFSNEDKISYFDIEKEKSSFEKQSFSMKLQNKCKEIETVFDKVVALNQNAIQGAKDYVSSKESKPIDYSHNININNAILANR